ncbi:FKBP-type peptidyl-prolyl cis-trans isomerase [Pseudofrankia inefficax]|uniref:Peptidyl-prolyl cis-trans isomerase n=1 Tax=Pseudofrankia inefficax (strain DSM 45817 / CECT 9037 / DDB 130130 / EuI1c) TaxID=298654 RepID=E3J2U1_PSEI1|nr:FKBP-type peptidyl-prolyl cis-trans isomerase [Pseudofrankia inefficax]ADP81752.1 peptidylprolyl isomerase FKBP-type [Pseudofrankia inefficax]
MSLLASVPTGGRGAHARMAFAVPAAAVVLLVAAAAGCSSSTAPDGTAAAPVPSPTVAAVPATVLPVVGNPTNLTVQPAVGAGQGLPPTKLVVKDLVTGTGTPATSSATVTVNYVGVLWNTGKTFDASWTGGQPATFPLDQVIPGFAQGIAGSVSDAVAGMRVGGRREIVIPPALGYGPQGGQGSIKADDTIVFVVDLLDVTAAATGTAPTGATPTSTAAANG